MKIKWNREKHRKMASIRCKIVNKETTKRKKPRKRTREIG